MLQAYKVSKVISLSESILGYLKENDEFTENETVSPYKTIGGILLNTNFTWYANGPRLEVVNSKTGAKISAWTFGSILKDTSTKVVCVAEIPSFNIDLPLIVVGLECTLTGGSICVFDVLNSKVLRVVQIKDKVTSIHVVNSGNDIFSTLGPLRTFDGVIAVGIVGGDVYLVDLCQHAIDDARYSHNTREIKDELDACQITVLTFKDIDKIEHHKQRTAQLGNHLAIHLNAIENNTSPHFVLKGPKGEDRIHANKSEVIVSALHYSPQLGSILIGYNFGAWQMWNIINMELVYTSPVYEGNIPVSHFAVQEPTDDPRIFCYIWAVYSNTEPYQSGFPIAVLYALNFECKEWHDGYGYLYEVLQSCTVRFQTELSLPHHTTCNGRPKGGHCLRLHAFNKGCTNRSSMLDSHEDTLTVCSVVWNIWCAEKCVHTLLSIFDLNQWYKEQLPALPDPSKYKSYMSYVSLSDLVRDSTNENSCLLDAHINETSINQFVGAQKLEEHYYPSTLAFESTVCSDNKIVHITSQGQQRALLTFVDITGPLILLRPVELFEESIKLGLTPLFMELPQVINITYQREHILGIVLEQQMVGWLCKCAAIWCNGSYTSLGCSLDFFLLWAWNRAVVLKANADKLCIPLFDYSRVKLDTNSQRMLNNCFKQLSNLSIVYDFVCTKLSSFLPNPEVVHQQWNSIHLVSVYLEVLQWLLNVRLLPEHQMSTEQLDSLGAPYPLNSLLEYYNDRRAYLQTLNKQKNSNSSLLFIDNLIDLQCGGDQLHKHWEDDGGNGLYPPQSLQALLLTYLIDGADLTCKHCVVFYVFLDLAMALDQDRYKVVITHLIKFPAVFKLSSSVIKITQAFWQLDHGDFETAMELLLDAHICPGDLEMWHHRVVLNALLAQDQFNFALLYLQVRRPPLTELEDLYKAMSLFISNNMLDEAFYYQRHNSTKENELALLRHIFKECNKNNQMRQLITYGLSQCEEAALMKYLEEVNHPEIEEFQVIYYLQQSRYMDIFELQGNRSPGQLGLIGQRNVNFKDGMVKTLSNFFPKISRNLINVCRQERQSLCVKVDRPKPMSVAIHSRKDKAKYKSMLMQGILKARETWADSFVNEKLSNEETPFLRTPTATPTRLLSRIPMISQRLIGSNDSDDNGPSPSKKIKLTPRPSLGSTSMLSKSFLTVSCLTHLVRLDTPIVKRKVSKALDFTKLEEKYNVCTPQSILKVRKLMSQSSQSSGDSTPKPASILFDSKMKEATPEITPINRALRITPRKSLTRSIVHFEKLNDSSSLTTTSDSSGKRYNDTLNLFSKTSNDYLRKSSERNATNNSWQLNDTSSTTESSIKKHEDDTLNLSVSRSSNELTRKSLELNTTKNSSQSTEDIYYSPESSLNSSGTSIPLVAEVSNTPKVLEVPDHSKDISVESNTKSFIPRITLTEPNEDSVNKVTIAEIHQIPDEKLRKSQKFPPRSRRSYRDETSTSMQTRLRSRQSAEKELPSSPKIETPKKIEAPRKIQSPIGSISGRRSLSRQVLENNAFSLMFSTLNNSPNTEEVTQRFTSETMSETITEITSVTPVKVQEKTSLGSPKSMLGDTHEEESSCDSSDFDLSFKNKSLGLPSFMLDNSVLSTPSQIVSYESDDDNKNIEEKNEKDCVLEISDEVILDDGNCEADMIVEDNENCVSEYITLENVSHIVDVQSDAVIYDISDDFQGNEQEVTSGDVCEQDVQEDTSAASCGEHNINISMSDVSGSCLSSNQIEQNVELGEEKSNESAPSGNDKSDHTVVHGKDERENKTSDEVEPIEVIEISDTSEESSVNNSLSRSDYSNRTNSTPENLYGYEENNVFESDLDGCSTDIESIDEDSSEKDKGKFARRRYENVKKQPGNEVEESSSDIESVDLLHPREEGKSDVNVEKRGDNRKFEEIKDQEEVNIVTDESTRVICTDKAISETVEVTTLIQTTTDVTTNTQQGLEVSFEKSTASIGYTESPKDITLNETELLDNLTSRPPEISQENILDTAIVEESQVTSETSYDDSFRQSDSTQKVLITEDPIPATAQPPEASGSTEQKVIEDTILTEDSSQKVLIKEDPIPATAQQPEASGSAEQKVIEGKSQENVRKYVSSRLRKRVTSCDIESTTSPIKSKVTRKRSLSVDEPMKINVSHDGDKIKNEAAAANENVASTPRRRLRSNSTETKLIDEEAVPSRNRRAGSVHASLDSPNKSHVQMAPKTKAPCNVRSNLASIIEEIPSVQAIKQKEKQKSPVNQLEEYSTTRRLTRHQRSIMEKAMDVNEATGSSFKEDLDPHQLLDSPSSSITDSSAGGKVRTRRQSQDSLSASSVVSTVASNPDAGSPKKRGRPRRNSVDSTASSDRQLRSASSPFTSKKGSKSSQKSAVDAAAESSPDVRRSTRTRLKSITPEKSDSESVSSRKSVRRQLLSLESDLPQIPEENSSETSKEVKDESEVRKGRKRKTSTKS